MEKTIEIIKYIAYIFQSIWEHLPIKGALVSVFLFYDFLLGGSLNPFAVKSVIILVIFDFITGIIAAKVSGDEIKSSKVVRSAFKFLVYLMLIAGAHVTEYAVPVISSFADETIIAFLAITELISVIENTGKMGFAVPKKLLNKLIELRDK